MAGRKGKFWKGKKGSKGRTLFAFIAPNQTDFCNSEHFLNRLRHDNYGLFQHFS